MFVAGRLVPVSRRVQDHIAWWIATLNVPIYVFNERHNTGISILYCDQSTRYVFTDSAGCHDQPQAIYLPGIDQHRSADADICLKSLADDSAFPDAQEIEIWDYNIISQPPARV